MSRSVHTIEIDSIVLSGIDLKQDRAERIRTMMEIELQRLLERKGLSESLVGEEISRLEMPEIYLTKPYDEEEIASCLAMSIYQALLSIR
jgi:CheY-like chemotaxis protein